MSTVPKKLDLMAWLDNVNRGGPDLSADGLRCKSFPSFIVLRILAAFPDTLGAVYECTCNPSMTAEQVYRFLRSKVPHRKRFAKFPPKQDMEDAELLARHYKCSMPRAFELRSILTEQDMVQLRADYK